MKKPLLVACLVISFLVASTQISEQQNQGLSRTQKMQQNKTGNRHNNSRVQEFKEIAYLHQTSTDGISWIGADSSNQFNYDGNGNLLSELIQTWNGTTWANSAYDSSVFVNNDEIIYVALTWDNVHNTWVNNNMATYTYDSINYLITDTTYMWNSTSGSWDYQNLTSYTYDSSGNELTRILQAWNNNLWQNNTEYIRTYDTLNLATSQLTLAWNNLAWDSTYLSYLNYDVYSNEISTYFLSLNTTTDTWNMYGYDTSTYEPISIQVTFLYLAWNADSNSYLPSYGDSLSYDELGNNTSELYYVYNDTVATNTNQWFYYYGVIDVSGIKSISANPGFTLYPNPASNRLTIEMNGLQADELRLYDVTGQLVADIRSPQYNQVDVSQLSAGVYIAEVVVNNNVSRSKWVKM